MPDYDRLCVQSWLACGFRIVSVNFADEIPALAARHPEVEFVAVEANASDLFGRRTPFIKDVLSLLSRQPEPVLGLVNSDIVLEPAPSWHRLESLVSRKTLIAGQRYDTASLDGGSVLRYPPGFDYFFFGREAAAELADTPSPFSMGLPWWDYWFPLVLAMRGYEIVTLARPAALHLGHGAQTGAPPANWRRLARAFALAIADEPFAIPASPFWEDFRRHCEDLAAAPESMWSLDDVDERIIRLCDFAVPLIVAKAETWQGCASASPPAPRLQTPFTPDTIGALFADLPARAAAGLSFLQGLSEEKAGRLDEARSCYRTAAEQAPRDAGIQTAFGNFLIRRGELHVAVAPLRKAAELQPHSAAVLNSLGSVLGQLDCTSEAIACFENALLADPFSGPTYFNLALARFPHGHPDVIRRLDEALARSPEFPNGQEWRRRILATIAGLCRPSAPQADPFSPRPGRF